MSVFLPLIDSSVKTFSLYWQTELEQRRDESATSEMAPSCYKKQKTETSSSSLP